MATRIILAISPVATDEESKGGSASYNVEEPFDQALDLVVPLQAPSSALEARQKLVFNKTAGGRVFVRPETVVVIEECDDEEA